MDKFKMELTWHNCKTCPPEELENNFLLATDGDEVFKATWDSLHGYYCKYDSGIYLPLFNSELYRWWWADIAQTVHKTPEFKENTNV